MYEFFLVYLDSSITLHQFLCKDKFLNSLIELLHIATHLDAHTLDWFLIEVLPRIATRHLDLLSLCFW